MGDVVTSKSTRREGELTVYVRRVGKIHAQIIKWVTRKDEDDWF